VADKAQLSIEDINADWIKYVVGKDGKTTRESELELYAELSSTPKKSTIKHLISRMKSYFHSCV